MALKAIFRIVLSGLSGLIKSVILRLLICTVNIFLHSNTLLSKTTDGVYHHCSFEHPRGFTLGINRCTLCVDPARNDLIVLPGIKTCFF